MNAHTDAHMGALAHVCTHVYAHACMDAHARTYGEDRVIDRCTTLPAVLRLLCVDMRIDMRTDICTGMSTEHDHMCTSMSESMPA